MIKTLELGLYRVRKPSYKLLEFDTQEHLALNKGDLVVVLSYTQIYGVTDPGLRVLIITKHKAIYSKLLLSWFYDHFEYVDWLTVNI